MNRKNSKCGAYYCGLIKKSGLILPAFGALALFAILFYVRFVGMFDSLKAASPVGFWLLIALALVGVVLVIAYIVTKLKSKELGAHDTLLLTLAFLMVYLLVGTIIFNFVCIETVYYGVALVAVIVLSVLRVMFYAPECCCCEEKEIPPANTTVKKYMETVINKFGFWVILMASVLVLGALLLTRAWGFTHLFFTKASYTVGIALVGAIAVIAAVYAFVTRIVTREINSVDGLVMFALFAFVLSGIMLIGHFSLLKLTIWLIAICFVFTLIRILATNTYIKEEATDLSFFNTSSNKNMAKGPKVYFKKFVKSFNMLVLGAIALFVFAVFDALVATNFLGWAADNGFMLFAVIAMLLFAVIGIAYVCKTFKKNEIGNYDALLWILDVSLLLTTVPVFANFDGVSPSLIIWAICLCFSIAFTITRLFMVKEPVAETEAVEAEATEAVVEEGQEAAPVEVAEGEEEAKKNQ